MIVRMENALWTNEENQPDTMLTDSDDEALFSCSLFLSDIDHLIAFFL